MKNKSVKILPIALSGMVNAFCIVEDRVILVDTGNPGSGDKILKFLSLNKIEPEDISLILITHCHMDHFGGLSVLKEKISAPVAIHKSSSHLLKEGKNAAIVPRGILGTIMNSIFKMFFVKANHPGTIPDIIIDNELDLKEYGVNGKVISTPGHTPDSVSLILDSSDIILGDLIAGELFNQSIPMWPPFASDMPQLKKSVELLMSYNPETIYAAHGGPFTKQSVMYKLLRD